MSRGRRRLPGAALDCAFLAALVTVSVAPYVGGLGFYGDDWGFFQLLTTAEERSLPALVDRLYDEDEVLRQRPTQIAYLAGLFRLFGLDPLGYHLVNASLLAAAVVLFYLVLRELAQPRAPALAVAAVYALVPNYSSDRFWVAAHQATLSVVFLLACALAALRAVRAQRGAALLAGVAVAALAASGLAYEVTLPLLALVPALAVLHWRRLPVAARSSPALPLALAVAGALVLVAVVVFKAHTSVRVGAGEPYVDYARTLVVGLVRVDFGVYGLGLPYVVLWTLQHALDAAVLGLGLAVAVAVAAYVHRLASSEPGTRPAVAVRYVLGGLVAMLLGYAIFVVPTVVSLGSASLGNRIRIAAALGTAAVLVGVVMLAAAALQAPAAQRAAFAVAVGLLCGAGFVTTNTLARYWVSAYAKQREIVARLRADLPQLEPGMTVILDGACFERGGAYVFTGNRDVTGILAVRYGEERVVGSAITKAPRITKQGLVVHTFGKSSRFSYGRDLVVYNVARRRAYRLRDRARSLAYFRGSGFSPATDCLPGFSWRGPAPPLD